MARKHTSADDPRILHYIQAAERLREGEYALDISTAPPDEVGRLGEAMQGLARTLEARYREIQQLDHITSRINAGLLLDDILESVYAGFRDLIPYDRIGVSLLEDGARTVRARWAKSDQPVMKIKRGYSAPLEGSSLAAVLETQEPRIINDLRVYLAHKPDSESTRLITAEGMRSSLTCPLIANGVPVGFMFFSSTQPDTYARVHAQIFQRIAQQLSVIVEKGRLVSELAAQKTAIEQQNAELRRLNELKNSFLGMAAHDLRNPIGAVQLMVQLIQDPAANLSEAEHAEFLSDINQLSDHMLTLLNDLLDVSQIESGNLSLHLTNLDVRPFLETCVARHATLASPKGTRVLLAGAPPGRLAGDPQRLRQVMDNLISNAVKYAPPGSTVHVLADKTPAGWRFSVRDEGPGLTAQDRERLFQDFARLSAKPTGGEKSTGLGLAITRRVVEAHGGQIGADSEPGRGATFWFTLPHGEVDD